MKFIKNIKPNFYRVIQNVWARIREDTLEMLIEFKVPKEKTKKLNIWVYLFLTICLLLGVWLLFPLLAGMLMFVFTSETSSTVASPSSQAVITFILLSTAFGTLILWFAERRGTGEKEQEITRTIKLIGKQFMLSAMLLTIFLLLSPLLPQIRENNDTYSVFIKYITLISFILGSILFTGSIIESFFYILRM